MTHRTARVRKYTALSTLIIGLAVVALTSASLEASEIWVEAWRHETTRPLRGIAVGDVTGDGQVEVVTLTQETVTVYALAAEGPRFLTAIEGIPERPTAVGVYPYEGGGPFDVWVGTQNPGIIYLYRYDPATRSFQRLERIRYAWADIERVIPFDLDGWGYADLAVVTNQRELVVFRWTPEGYQRVPVGEFDKDIRFVEARDVQGDSREELIIARGANHLAVLSWQSDPSVLSLLKEIDEHFDSFDKAVAEVGYERAVLAASAAYRRIEDSLTRTDLGQGALVKTWENYVWGTHLSLFVDEFRKGRPPEIVAVTSQKVAHHFAASDDGFAPVRPPVDWPAVTGGLIGTSDIDDDGVAEIVEATQKGLGAWSISTQMNREESVELSKPPVFAFAYDSLSRRLIVAGTWGFSLLTREDSNFVKVVTKGAVAALTHPPLFVDGVAYLSADDWADLLGMRLRFDPDSGRISGLRGFHFLVGRVGEAQWIYDGRPKETLSRPMLRGDLLYLGADFARIVGADIFWETFTRTLVVDP